MLVLRHRLAIAGVIAAAAIAVPVAALAAAPGSPPAKPGPPPTAAPGASKSPPPACAQASPDGAAAASKKAAAASQPDVAAPGASKSPPPGEQALPAPVAAFIARLGVGTDAGGRAFKEVDGLVRQGGKADPASPAFAAIAREAGVSPDRLAAAWDSVSQAAAGL